MLPTIGLRVLNRASGHLLAYSADTEPGEGIRYLARGVNLLVHEASGESLGHSSAAQAGNIAREAGVERLVLVHYSVEETPREILEEEARKTFGGHVYAARDFDRFTW